MNTKKQHCMWGGAIVIVLGIGLAGNAWADGLWPGLPSTTSCQTKLNTCNTDLQTCQTDLAQAGKFPATGQTTCWDTNGNVIACAGTGQDGDIRAGGTLSYTDNGDGTITDNNTRLVWEKQSDDGSIHDKDNTYLWGEAFTVHIAGLNTEPCFAGHCDWRLPNVKELQSIINYQNDSPAVSAAFNTGCVENVTVLQGSCTVVHLNYLGIGYWSSTSLSAHPGGALIVGFATPHIVSMGKYNHSLYVRAVRGGL